MRACVDLLDRVPDTELPLAEIPWPPLAKKPSKEHFGVLQPIANYPIGKHHHHNHHHHEHHHEHD